MADGLYCSLRWVGECTHPWHRSIFTYSLRIEYTVYSIVYRCWLLLMRMLDHEPERDGVDGFLIFEVYCVVEDLRLSEPRSRPGIARIGHSLRIGIARQGRGRGICMSR